MPTRRDFLTASIAALAGLASLVNNAEASQSFSPLSAVIKPQNLVREVRQIKRVVNTHPYKREEIIFSYKEWKAFREAPQDPRTEEEITLYSVTQGLLRAKASLMTKNPRRTLELLTPKEIQDYQSELKMFNQFEDVLNINMKYGLNLSREEFQNNIGAMFVWSLNRHYSYRYSDEKTKSSKKK